jgi:hypothetical protein
LAAFTDCSNYPQTQRRNRSLANAVQTSLDEIS